MLRKVDVITSDDYTIYQAYTDGSMCNGWLNVWMTASQISEWMDGMPYDLRIMPNGDAIIYLSDEDTLSRVENVITEDGIMDLYNLNGYEFMMADEWKE